MIPWLSEKYSRLSNNDKNAEYCLTAWKTENERSFKIYCYHLGERTLPLEQASILTDIRSNTFHQVGGHFVFPAYFS